MRTRVHNNEVLFPDEPIVRVAQADMEQLQAQAVQNERHRMRLCAHHRPDDPLQEMLIVLTARTYIRPHKHLNKSESVHVIVGQAEIVIFGNGGEIVELIPLGEYASGSCFYYRLAESCYHTVRVVSPVFAFHETTGGPFRRGDTEYPAWAPAENDTSSCEQYVQQLARTMEEFRASRATDAMHRD